MPWVLALASLGSCAGHRYGLNEQGCFDEFLGVSFVQRLARNNKTGHGQDALATHWDRLLPCRSCYCEELDESNTFHARTWGQLLRAGHVQCHYNACEKPRMFQSVRAPANAHSSLAFAFVGVLVLSAASSGWPPALRFHMVHYGLVLLAEGAGSFGYHASLTQEMNMIDIRTMMSSLAGQGVGLFLVRSLLLKRPVKAWTWSLSYLVFNVVLFGALFLSCGCVCSLRTSCETSWMPLYVLIGALCFTAPVALEVSIHFHILSPEMKGDASKNFSRLRWFMWTSVALWPISGLFKVLDDWKVWCNPSSAFQFVAMMHLTMAIAMLLNVLSWTRCIQS